jgi:hypothetical protein
MSRALHASKFVSAVAIRGQAFDSGITSTSDAVNLTAALWSLNMTLSQTLRSQPGLIPLKSLATLWAVRWYCSYGISYRDLERMMGERGVSVDHSTIYRWVQKYTPEIEKRLCWQWHRPQATGWLVDETYVKVGGKWAYLYRGARQAWKHDRFLSLTNTECLSRRTLPWQGAQWAEGLGEARDHQHGQSADLRYRDFSLEG